MFVIFSCSCDKKFNRLNDYDYDTREEYESLVMEI